MTAPHIRDLNLGDWHEVPKGATIPAGTLYIRTSPGGTFWTWRSDSALGPGYRIADARYFTAEPIPDPREEEIEEEARRLCQIFYPEVEDAWRLTLDPTRDRFRTLAIDSLDRQAARES